MAGDGLSKARLGRMHEVMSGYVERGEVPGIVAAVSRHGEVHVNTIGAKALGGDPIGRDTLFRITSMTKPITAVAAMILVEECTLRLDEPIDRLLPELSGRRVLHRLDGPLDETVAAYRPISVRDLLTFRMGFGGVAAAPGTTLPVQDAMRELFEGWPAVPPEPDEWMRRLGALPLMHQPGERWMYGTSADVLGVLIARASGQPFETFLRERLFEPLGMTDTGFCVPAAKLDRLATSYWTSPETGALTIHDEPDDSLWSWPPVFPSGGGSPTGGLVSTIDDYLAFGQMLLGRGTERILSRPSVEIMTTDQLTPHQKEGSGFYPGYFDSRGWGFGMSVITKRDDVAGSVGTFGWDGGLGTSWRSDPREDLVTILMTQASWTSPCPPNVCLDFWTSAYQAL